MKYLILCLISLLVDNKLYRFIIIENGQVIIENNNLLPEYRNYAGILFQSQGELDNKNNSWDVVYILEKTVTNFKVKNTIFELPLESLEVNLKILNDDKKNFNNFNIKLDKKKNIDFVNHKAEFNSDDRKNWGFSLFQEGGSKLSFYKNVYFKKDFNSEMDSDKISFKMEVKTAIFAMNNEDLTFDVEINDFEQRIDTAKFNNLFNKNINNQQESNQIFLLGNGVKGEGQNQIASYEIRINNKENNTNGKTKEMKSSKHPLQINIYCEYILDNLKRSFNHISGENLFVHNYEGQSKNEKSTYNVPIEDLCDLKPQDSRAGENVLSNPFKRQLAKADIESFEMWDKNGVLVAIKFRILATSKIFRRLVVI